MKPIDPSDLKALVPLVDEAAVRPAPVRRLERPVSWDDVAVAPSADGYEVAKMGDGSFCVWKLVRRCGVCNGIGKVCTTSEFTDLPWDSPCPCRSVVRVLDRLNNARIPWSYYYVSRDYLTSGQQWIDRYAPKSQGIRFVGPTGRGKTHAALCTVHGLCHRGISARYVSWALWLDDMRQAMGRESDMATLRARIEQPVVVVLDDIGRERDTDWAQSQLDQLLERRVLDGATILLASNLTDERLEQHLGDRLWSRIKHSTESQTLTGKDWRAKKVQKERDLLRDADHDEGRPCPDCGGEVHERKQRLIAADLPTSRLWWIARLSCRACGWLQDELSYMEKA